VPLKIPVALTRRVAEFDAAVDGALDGLRGRRVPDRLFYGASALGEHGMIWLFLAAAQCLRGDRHWRAAIRVFIGEGLESLVVNGAIKSMFHRARPAVDAPRPLPLRIPLTSSFPSGHASSSFFSAALLADDDPALAPLYYGLAVVVSLSRIYVRIHHASDVVGGVVVGAGLGHLAKLVAPLDHPESR
jgi:undecaprenyl-diphosphatase